MICVLLLTYNSLRPKGDVTHVALEELAVGHAEEQAGLGVVNGVVVDIDPVSEQCYTLAVEYRLLVA